MIGLEMTGEGGNVPAISTPVTLPDLFLQTHKSLFIHTEQSYCSLPGSHYPRRAPIALTPPAATHAAQEMTGSGRTMKPSTAGRTTS